jgi:hypothetical protein
LRLLVAEYGLAVPCFLLGMPVDQVAETNFSNDLRIRKNGVGWDLVLAKLFPGEAVASVQRESRIDYS